MVEAAWRAVDGRDYGRLRFQQLGQRLDEHKAIVAIAHEGLIVIWHVLTERATDQQANPDRVAFKFMTWSGKLTDAQRDGLTTRQFVRAPLRRLPLGENLTPVIRGGSKHLIAPPDEVLALKPELRTVA